jgi:hypothetical protein
MFAVVLGVILTVAAVGVYELVRGLGSGQPIGLAAAEVQFSGEPCPGWTDLPLGIPITGGTIGLQVRLATNASSGSCTAESVSMNTPGFSVVGSNIPLTVDAGSVRSLNVTVQTPSKLPVGAVAMTVDVGAVSA